MLGYRGPSRGLCRYEISQHPEVEQRIVEELRSLGVEAGGDASEVLTYANLGQLAYLDATIKARCTPAAYWDGDSLDILTAVGA